MGNMYVAAFRAHIQCAGHFTFFPFTCFDVICLFTASCHCKIKTWLDIPAIILLIAGGKVHF